MKHAFYACNLASIFPCCSEITDLICAGIIWENILRNLPALLPALPLLSEDFPQLLVKV